MKVFVLLTALVAVASAMIVKDDMVLIGKENLVDKDIRVKETIIMKLLNNILQPTMYADIRDCAKEWTFDNHLDKFMKTDVVKMFLDTYKMGMLPRGEIFVPTSTKQMYEAVKVFHVLYYAKDFDTFIRCACWFREHINEGMFVYAMTVAVLHRDDCRGIIMPAPYEIYPYFFVNTDVIHKAFMMKLKKGVVDPVLLNYYNIRVNEKNVVLIDTRKDVRHALTVEDRLNYFTEDIDLNTYFYYFHMDYHVWMTSDDMMMINKERRGEMMMYLYQQLLARYRLERLSHEMCDIKPLMFTSVMKTGYWPKIRMHNGEEMPMRMNNMVLATDEKLELLRLIDDMERMIRDAILRGHIEMHDGTVLKIKKPEDIEVLARMMFGKMGFKHHGKFLNFMHLYKRMLTYQDYNIDTYTYVPMVTDMYQTCLRDPMYWKLMKRITNTVVLFKKLLPKYTRDELDFPGVKVEGLSTDKLVTFFDEYDMDITNAVYMNDVEMHKRQVDMLMVARQRRLNHHSFKVTIDVVSDKTVDSIVRVFLGPKYDCMGRLMDLNRKRMDMVEIDTFMYKLETGKNTIVRDSTEMHNIIGDRPWTRKMWDQKVVDMMGGEEKVVRDTWWHKDRTGFPHRLLLPMGRRGGLEMQLYVIITPVRTGMMMSNLDMEVMRDRKVCRFSVCMDTMPLGFPFDREIDMPRFFTNNMKMADVMIFHKDIEMMNTSKNIDFTNMVMKHDDMTYMDKDMFVNSKFMDRDFDQYKY